MYIVYRKLFVSRFSLQRESCSYRQFHHSWAESWEGSGQWMAAERWIWTHFHSLPTLFHTRVSGKHITLGGFPLKARIKQTSNVDVHPSFSQTVNRTLTFHSTAWSSDRQYMLSHPPACGPGTWYTLWHQQSTIHSTLLCKLFPTEAIIYNQQGIRITSCTLWG